MPLEELRAKLRDLEGTRRVAHAELGSIKARQERVDVLEGDRDDLLEYMAVTVPETLENLTGQERNQLYRMLRLEVTPSSEGYEVRGAFCPLGLPPSKTPKATTFNSTSRREISFQLISARRLRRLSARSAWRPSLVSFSRCSLAPERVRGYRR
jgi:hypothetical protein